MVIEHPQVLDRMLATPNITAALQESGITFVPVNIEETEVFDNLAARILAEAAGHAVLSQLDKPATILRPSTVLSKPLTPPQIATVNNTETHAIAQYCIEIQEQLAKVPIRESYEPLVSLPELFAKTEVPVSFSGSPFHPACGRWAGKPRELWAREAFAERLVLMGRLIGPVGLQLYIEDAFRPNGVQEGLFKRRYALTKDEHPAWSEAQLVAESRSKTAVTPRLASHKGGAAIDARLQDIQTGRILDFGHEYPDGGALVFPASPYVTFEQWRNRQIFRLAAELSGLTLYVGEDWHISYGDNLAALDEHGTVRPDYVAMYGPIKDFDRTTGQITETYEEPELDAVFSHQG